MKLLLLPPAFAAMLLVSCATSRPDVAARAGVNHNLARGTGAETWAPAAGKDGPVPGGLIWRARLPTQGVMLCLHGVQTHSAWFARLAPRLNDAGWTVIAADRRGSGTNSGAGFVRGHTRGKQELLADLGAQMTAARVEARGKRVVLLGTSWGSNPASTFALDASRTNRPDGLVQLVPATEIRQPHEPGLLGKLGILVGGILLPRSEVTLRFGGQHYLAGQVQQPDKDGKLSAVPPAGENPVLAEHQAKNEKLRQIIAADVQAETLLTHPTSKTMVSGSMLGKEWKKTSRRQAPPLPVLVVTATRDQIMNNAGAVNAFRGPDGQVWPQVSLASVDAGHGVQVTDAGTVADKILAWTKKKW